MAAPGVEGLNPEIERHFYAAADLDTEARQRYFNEQGVDAETRAAVERLVEFDRSSDRILGRPLASVAAKIEQSAPDHVGPYKVIREIGRGGMGAVYEAERSDGELNLRVAVKFVSRAIRSDFIVERFKRERQILANLNHPNICRVLDAGTTEDGLPYLVMELIEGQTVDEWATGRTTAEICALFRHVCDAVQHAHQNLVVHRDLKPGNILVTAAGQPKLLDFGIAKLLDSAPSTIHNTIRALTPAYAAPEQVAGLPVTTAADVYGLGCVLYHLLTGHAPERLPGQEIPPAASQNPALHGELDALISRAMKPAPLERFGTAREMGDELERWLVRKPRSTPWMALGGAAAALLVGFAWWRSVWVERQLLAIVDESHRTMAAAPQTSSVRGALRQEWQARLSGGFAHAPGALAIADGLRSVGDYAAAAKILAGLDHSDGAEAIVRVLTLESRLAMDLGHLEQAAQFARRAMSLDASTGSGESAIQCADVERRLGKLAEARMAINQAIAWIGPWGDAAYFDELARILEDSGDVTQALQAAESALRMQKDSREYQSRLGQLLEASGERERARKQYETVVSRPDSAMQVLSPTIRAQRIGDLLRYRPTVEEGVRRAAELLAEFPQDRYARWMHARAWNADGANAARADAEYVELLDESPQDADLLREFAANRMAWVRLMPLERVAASCADGLRRLAATPHPAVALLARQLQQVCSSR